MIFPRLRDMREDKEMRQQDVADKLGIRQTVYSRYERGDQDIPVRHLLVLADLYHASTDYLLGRTDDPTPPKHRCGNKR